jgi:S-adenosylmethionine-diacylglycerol 3-amino-3-carboxypropyl transferase
VPGEIAYSQCWEDPDTVRAALRITPDDDVLVITSGGCNVLALLLDQPRSITAVDINPAQSFLLELKLGAVQSLCHPDLLAFVGATPSADRRELYRRVRGHLSAGAQQYWDRRPDAVRRGIIHSGRFERYLNIFRRLVLPLVHSQDRVEQALRPKSLAEQRLFYDGVWDSLRWRALFRIYFGRWLLSRFGRHAGAFRHAALRDVSAHYLKRARHALTEVPVADNYFLQYMAAGEYKTALPAYLDPRHTEALRSLAPRLRTVTADLGNFLERAPAGAFSKFYFSDIFEFFSRERYEAALAHVVRVARPGARLCYFNNLVTRSHPQSLDSMMRSEDHLARSLHWNDRSFVYQRVVVERVTT